jgi:glycosyltransferase involved in cell wall biosynthesis
VAISPKVSVAMCTFNGAQFISEQLQSIAAQSTLPAELVISDDASTDNTVVIVRETLTALAVSHPEFARVHVLIEVNRVSLGVTKNFEQAIALSTREYVFLTDQDDVWASNRIEAQLAELEMGAGFVFSDAELIDQTGEPLGRNLFATLDVSARERREIEGSSPVTVLIRRNIVTGATAAFHRRIFEVAKPFPESWVHDEWLAMMAAVTREKFVILPSLIRYRQHGQNQIGVQRQTAATRLAKLTARGRDRNTRLLARARDLAARISGGEVSADSRATALISQAVQHQTVRSAFCSNRLARFGQVAAEVGSGRYFRVSNGFRDVLRDVVQPL